VLGVRDAAVDDNEAVDEVSAPGAEDNEAGEEAVVGGSVDEAMVAGGRGAPSGTTGAAEPPEPEAAAVAAATAVAMAAWILASVAASTACWGGAALEDGVDEQLAWGAVAE